VKKQKIILVSLFYYEKSDNIRISTIYRLLKEEGAEVELITTGFNHREKRKHDPKQHPSDITFLPVPGYNKNVGFRRPYSHLVFALRLRNYLKKLSYRPSKVYCLVPAVSAGWACNRYCRKNKIPFVVDVIDLWPESFIILSSHKKILRLVTFPWKKIAAGLLTFCLPALKNMPGMHRNLTGKPKPFRFISEPMYRNIKCCSLQRLRKSTNPNSKNGFALEECWEIVMTLK